MTSSAPSRRLDTRSSILQRPTRTVGGRDLASLPRPPALARRGLGSPPVHREHLPGDPARRLGRKELHGPGDVLGGPETAGVDGFEEPLLPLGPIALPLTLGGGVRPHE